MDTKHKANGSETKLAQAKTALIKEIKTYANLEDKFKALKKAYEASVSSLITAMDESKATIMADMNEAGLTEFDCVAGTAEIKVAETSYVDVKKLRDLCPDEPTFLKVVSATQKDVTSYLGDMVLQKCLKREVTGKKLKIKVK